MENGKILFNNIDSLNANELKALNAITNNDNALSKQLFIDFFEEEYDYSYRKFKTNIINKAKGNVDIKINSNFHESLTEAIKHSPIYDVQDYLQHSDVIDKEFLKFAKTKESQKMIVDYIANDKSFLPDDIMKANASYFKGKTVTHGLYAFSGNAFSMNKIDNDAYSAISRNLQTIIKNNDIELSMSSGEYMIGPIGISGEADISAYYPTDLESTVNFEGKRIHHKDRSNATGIADDILELIERPNEKGYFTKHDELIGKNFKINSLWVKEDFYNNNEQFVNKLANEHGIKNIDIIHASENTEKITSSQIERINIDDINKKQIAKSSIIDPKQPIKPNESLNEIYQNIIDERLYSYKDKIIDLYEQNQMYTEANRIKSLGIKEFTTELRQDLDGMFEKMIPENQKQLLKQLGESTTYSGLYYGEIIEKRSEEFINMINNLPIKQDALILRKNDSLILFAHGSPEGNIIFNGAEYNPEAFVQKLYDKNLIPDDIKSIYTMNCYGGKQQSFINSKGVKVSSAHTSTTPIVGTAMLNPEKPMFGISLNTGDMTDEFKRFSMEEGSLDVLYSSKEINDAFGFIEPKKTKTWTYAEVTSVERINEENITDKIINEEKTNNINEIEKTNNKGFVLKENDKGFVLKENVEKNTKSSKKLINKTTKQITKNTTEKAAKKTTKVLSKKTLGGNGKLAIGLSIAGLIVGGAILADNSPKKEKKNKKQQNNNQIQYNNQMQSQQIDNSYSMQMAKDISSYRYGKRMTGFVNN